MKKTLCATAVALLLAACGESETEIAEQAPAAPAPVAATDGAPVEETLCAAFAKAAAETLAGFEGAGAGTVESFDGGMEGRRARVAFKGADGAARELVCVVNDLGSLGRLIEPVEIDGVELTARELAAVIDAMPASLGVVEQDADDGSEEPVGPVKAGADAGDLTEDEAICLATLNAAQGTIRVAAGPYAAGDVSFAAMEGDMDFGDRTQVSFADAKGLSHDLVCTLLALEEGGKMLTDVAVDGLSVEPELLWEIGGRLPDELSVEIVQ